MHKKWNLTSFATMALPICMALVFVLFSGTIANAAVKYWIGGGGGNFSDNTRWSTASGGANNTTAPVAADLATFNGSGLGSCTITADPNVGGINIVTGYNGTITQNTGITLTIGAQHFAQDAGTFTGGNSAITVNGNWSLTNGTFTASSGTMSLAGNCTRSAGTFTHNSGTITLTGSNARTINTGAAVLYNLIVNINTNAVTITGTVNVAGNLTLTSYYTIIGGTIAVAGNVISTIVDAPPSNPSTGQILFNGSGAQLFSAGGATGTLPGVSINKTGGTLTLQDTMRVYGSAGWTWTAGTVNGGTSTVVFYAYNNGITMTVNSGSMTFNNVTVDMEQNDLTVTGSMTVSGNLTITSVGNIQNGTIAVAGNVTTDDTTSAGPATGTILLNGTAAQVLGTGGGGASRWLPAISVNKTSGTLTLQDTINIHSAGGWTWIAGTVNGGTSTVVFYANANGSSMTVNSGAMTFNNVTIDMWLINLNVTGNLNVGGNLLITTVDQINTGTIKVAGNLTSTYEPVNGTAGITLNGTGAQTITTSGTADLPNGTLTIDKTSGTASFASAMSLIGGGNVTVNQGTLDLIGYSLAGVTTLSANSGATLKLQGGQTVTATTKTFNSGSTVYYNGAGTYASLAAGNSYSNLIFNNATGSWTHTGILTARDLTITAGTLLSGGRNINVSGNWSNSGSYTSGANIVTFNGTGQSITGNTTFNSFTKSVVAADTLTIAAGSTTTINGTATINGASGQLLSLVSSSSPTKWNFVLGASATKTISYVSVKDSDASGSAAGLKPIAPTNSTNAGNTVSWFVASVSGTVYSDEGSTIAVGKTIRLLVNGVSAGIAVSDASGNYSITAATAVGDALLLFISADATYKGTTVTVSNGGSPAGINIYAGYVITRHDNAGALTNANISTAKGAYAGGDAGDIFCSVVAGALTVSGTTATLYLPAGHSYTPGNTITTPAMKSLGTFFGASFSDTINGALTVAGGTYTASSGTTSIAGDFTISAGTFSHNSGTITLTGSNARTINTAAAALYNLIVNTNTNAVTITGTVNVANNLTLTSYRTIDGGTIAVAGNVVSSVVAVPSAPSTGQILFNGNGVQLLSASGATGTVPGVSINKTGGTLTLQDTLRVYGSAGWTWTAGTVSAGTSTVEFYASSSNGSSMTVSSGSMAFNHVTISMVSYDLTVTGSMTVSGNLTISSVGSIESGTIAVAGNVTTDDGSHTSPATGTILLNGTGAQVLGTGGGGASRWLPAISVNKTSGTLTLQDALNIHSAGGWTWTAGTVDGGTSTVVFYGLGNGVSMAANTGAMTFNNVSLDLGPWDLTVTGNLNVGGNLLITSVDEIRTGTIRVAGNLTSTDAAVSGDGSITLNGTGPQTITASAADLPNATLTIDKTSGTASLASALALVGGGNVTVNQGTLDLTGYSLTGVTTLTANSGATLKLQGGETVTATTKTFNSGSTVYYNGAGTYAALAAGNSYANLIFNNGTGSWTHAGTLTARDLTITAGTLLSNGQNINLSGNWSNSGSYTSGANTVTFNGTNQSIFGDTSFNGLTKSVAAADTLTFAAGSTQTFNGTVTLNGASGQLLSLVSSSSPTRWNFKVNSSATKAISYVSVRDSDASSSDASQKPINPANSIDPTGNTVAWFVYLLDAMIKLTSEGVGAYLTAGVYETTASTQVKSQGTVSGTAAQYHVQFQNNSGATDSVVVTGTASGSNFTVQYLDDTATDRTAAVTGGGYTISSLAAGTNKVWTLMVTPNGGGTPVAGGTSYDVPVTATSAGDNTKIDQVKAVTTSISANLTLLKSADRGTAKPGEEISYTTAGTNGAGLTSASGIVLRDPIPANTGFKVGGVSFGAGTSTLTCAYSYSGNNGTSWVYSPVSGGCSAPAGYDYCVTDVRWVMTGSMPTNTSFSVGMVVKVK